MECPGSPIPRQRGEHRRSVVDESEHEDEDDAKQKKQKQQKQKKEDEDADLKSALAFEPPPYSAPPPPYSPTVSPPPVVTAEPRTLPTTPVEEIRINAPVPKPAYVPRRSLNQRRRAGVQRVFLLPKSASCSLCIAPSWWAWKRGIALQRR